MGTWQWLLDLVVAVLLAATLLRAHRLDRALAALRRDRGALEALLGGFDSSAQQARAAIDGLRELTDGAARRIEHHTASARALQEDLALLVERGEGLAERLDQARHLDHRAAARATAPAAIVAEIPAVPPAERARAPQAVSGETRRVRSKAERDLLMALQAGR